MKLLMENWRGFVVETAKAQSYGNLYLFEEDTVQEVSFYDRLTALNENDDDFQIFLEQWETSVDYIFNNLEEQTGIEQVDDAILKVSTQAYTLLGRGKEKAHAAVLNLAKKAKARGGFGKVGAMALTALVAAATAFAISKAMEVGADESVISNIANAASDIVPNVGQAVDQAAQDPGSAVDQLKQMVDGTAQQLSQVDSEAAQAAADGAKSTSEVITDEFPKFLRSGGTSTGPSHDAYNLANKALQALGSGDKSAHMDAVNQLIDLQMDSIANPGPAAGEEALRGYDMSSLGNKKGIMDLMDAIQSAGFEATGVGDTAAEPRFGGGRGIQRALSKLKR